MDTTLLLFIPVLILVVLANIGQVAAWARRLTFALLMAAALLTAIAGVAALALPPGTTTDLLAPGLQPNQTLFGRWLLLTGILATATMAAALAAQRRGRDPHLGRLYWSRPVQATAILLILLYAGLNLAQSALIGDPAALAESGLAVGVGEVAGQNVAFVALAFLGVGAGIRRTWPAAAAHLHLTKPGLPQLLTAGLAALGMILLSTLVGGILTLVAPDSLANAEGINNLLVGSFDTVGGAITLGILTGIGEEVLYRGALQPAFGLWATSLIFAVHHLQYLNAALIVIFLLGLTLGWVRNRWGTTTAALTHAAYNAILLLLALAAGQLTGA